MHLSRMCILLFLDGVFCICLLGSINPTVLLESSASLFIFYLVVLSITEGELLKAPTTIVLLSISLFRSVHNSYIWEPKSLYKYNRICKSHRDYISQ